MQNANELRTITIGKKKNDSELIDMIIAYQKEKGLSTAPDAVRALCLDALAIKKATK